MMPYHQAAKTKQCPIRPYFMKQQQSEYESSENSSAEMPVASTSANKTSKNKPVQWKLKNLYIDPNLIRFKMNGE